MRNGRKVRTLMADHQNVQIDHRRGRWRWWSERRGV